MKDTKYKFLNDRPVKKDSIGHYNIIANQLFETIHCNLDKPFVIGLFGSWGTGKSSIIEMLELRCQKEKDKTKIVIVDAWRKDKEIFNRQFLKKVARELFEKDEQFEKIRKVIDEKETISTSGWKPSKIAWGFFMLFIIAFITCMAVALWGWYNNEEAINPFPFATIAGSITALLVACYFQLLLPRFSIGTNTHIDDISVHDIDYFRGIYFDKIIQKTKAERVCIVVDNLDRVEAEDALTIIRTLKTFIVDAKEDEGTGEAVETRKLNKVVFIVPCCDKELKNHIVKSGAVEDGAEFLHKFFNVSFRIPEFRVQDAFQYARELLDEMGLDFDRNHKNTICHIISEGYGKNPRKAKIFLNNFLMYYNVARACEKADKIRDGVITNHPDWLAIYLASKEESANGQSYFERLSREISPECEAAIRFLKKPNDFDLIEGLDELLQMAGRNEEKFTKCLSERASESQYLIDAIWRNLSRGDNRRKLNTIASVICAIETNGDIMISQATTDQMAMRLAAEFPQRLRDMSGRLVYNRILKGKPKEVLTAISHFEKNVNGIAVSQGQIEYCVDVMEAVLEDTEALFGNCKPDELQRLQQEMPKAIEKLVGFGDEILPIAIKYPTFKSKIVFERSLTRCGEGYLDILPDDIIEYCMFLDSTEDDDQFIKSVIRCFEKVLKYFQDEDIWDIDANEDVETKSKECTSFLKALRSINGHAYEHALLPQDSESALNTLNSLFDFVDDNNKLEILDTYKDYEKFKRWSGTMAIATSCYNSRGQELLKRGSEHVVYAFINNNRELVSQRLSSDINAAGNRFRSVCNLVLEAYPERRNSFISELWDEKSEWIGEWIKDNVSNINKEQNIEMQNTLFGIAENNEYPMNVYQALSYLDTVDYEEAVDARVSHLDKLIESEELSTIEGLEFVLERIGVASYRTTDEQNDLLNNGWREIDQRTAGKELKQLVKKVIRT